MYPITSRWSCCVGPGYSLLHIYSRDPDVFLIKFDHGRITQHKYHLGCSSYTLRHDRCLFTLLSLKIKIIYKKEDLSEKLRTFKSSRVCVYKTKMAANVEFLQLYFSIRWFLEILRNLKFILQVLLTNELS